jgi:hypothetical protein
MVLVGRLDDRCERSMRSFCFVPREASEIAAEQRELSGGTTAKKKQGQALRFDWLRNACFAIEVLRLSDEEDAANAPGDGVIPAGNVWADDRRTELGPSDNG